MSSILVAAACSSSLLRRSGVRFRFVLSRFVRLKNVAAVLSPEVVLLVPSRGPGVFINCPGFNNVATSPTVLLSTFVCVRMFSGPTCVAHQATPVIVVARRMSMISPKRMMLSICYS